MITARELRDENSKLKREDLQLVEVREALTATATPAITKVLQEQHYRPSHLCLRHLSKKLLKF